MPLPKPADDEEKGDFLDRCMGDDTMNKEYPDPKQRRAVCESQWESKPEGSASYGHVSNLLFNAPWAIMPEKLEAMVEVLSLRLQGVRFTSEEIEARVGTPMQRESRRAGAVQILPLYGVLSQRANIITQASGGTSLEQFGAALTEAVRDDEISGIVIDVDSPGGSVHGTPELAQQVYELRGRKPIVAVANSLMASAAYWIAASADEIAITPSGLVGSIGIVAEHVDVSKLEEKMGVKTTLITAGKFKGEGSPYEPLADEARAHVQDLMDDFYSMFMSAIARGRGVPVEMVRDGFGEGRIVGAGAAVKMGMADRVATFGQVVSDVFQRASSDGGRAEVPGERERLARLWDIVMISEGRGPELAPDAESTVRTGPAEATDSNEPQIATGG